MNENSDRIILYTLWKQRIKDRINIINLGHITHTPLHEFCSTGNSQHSTLYFIKYLHDFEIKMK